jgi:hypothetical protein
MMNTKDLAVRAGVCVKCHIGEPGRDVDHELIAAGHPPLIFELDAYTANMPPHWREPDQANASAGVQAWALGQAVSLRQSLELLADRAGRGRWPEFAEFECYSCHHELRDSSWRQQVGFGDRKPGSAIWSNPKYSLAGRWAPLVQEVRASADDYESLRAMLSNTGTPASEIADAASRGAATAARLIDVVARQKWDRNRLLQLLAELAAEPSADALDYASAANTTMALGAVFESVARFVGEPAASHERWMRDTRPHLDQLYDDVADASRYSASQFSADLRAFRNAVQPR